MALQHASDSAPSYRRPKSVASVSESEKSYVSAESRNASPVFALRDRVQPARSSTPPQSQDTADLSSSSSGFEQPTPLARRHAASSPAVKSTYPPSASQPGSYFALQPGNSGIEPRSPPSRRPPGSRSSRGIETRSGPPPALSTQRSHNADSPWRRLPPEPTSPEPYKANGNDSIDSVMEFGNQCQEAMHGHNRRETGANRRSLDAMATRRRERASHEGDQDSTIRINGRHSQSNSFDAKPNAKQEDLFLNLARADSVGGDALDVMSTTERRRSRGITSSRITRPASSGRPSSSGGRFFDQRSSTSMASISPQGDSLNNPPTLRSLASLRADLSRDRPYAASAHPADQQNRLRNTELRSKASFFSTRQDEDTRSAVYGRRRSIHTPQNHYDSSPLTQHPGSRRREDVNLRTNADDGTESTVSTTAPSTVWDELDDLKARIRNIELTGNLPSTSNAAMSTVYHDRPATASTTMTTASISPKRRKRASASPEASTIPENANVETHPLLHSALVNTKPVISTSLFRALEATATDALALASITGSKGSQAAGSAHAVAPTIDRQLRRKADNMCRNLTELCITLAGEKDATDNTTRKRPALQGSRENSTLTPSTLSTHNPAANDDPDLSASSRVLSRLEARRTSLRGSSSQNSPISPRLNLSTSSTPRSGALERSGSVIRRRDSDVRSNVSHARPLSRAATDADHRPSPQTRSSREYTSKHPLPSPPKGAGLGQVRQSYFPSPTQSALSAVRGAKREPIERSSPPDSGNARLAEVRQRRLASLRFGNGNSPTAAASSRRLGQVGTEQG